MLIFDEVQVVPSQPLLPRAGTRSLEGEGRHSGECERRRPKSVAVVGMRAAFGRGLVATRLPQHPREVSRLSDLVPCGSRIEFLLLPVGSTNRVVVHWCFTVCTVKFHCYPNKSFTVSSWIPPVDCKPGQEEDRWKKRRVTGESASHFHVFKTVAF